MADLAVMFCEKGVFICCEATEQNGMLSSVGLVFYMVTVVGEGEKNYRFIKLSISLIWSPVLRHQTWLLEIDCASNALRQGLIYNIFSTTTIPYLNRHRPEIHLL